MQVNALWTTLRSLCFQKVLFILYAETKKCQYFDISSLSLSIKLHEQYNNVWLLTLLNKNTFTIMRLFKFYKMYVQHMLSETDLSNHVQLSILRTCTHE